LDIASLQAIPPLPSYDSTALAMIKPRKHQRISDILLQSDVVTGNNRV